MKEIADWLIGIERMAGDIYRSAADRFADSSLGPFLEETAEDEAMHFHVMQSAAGVLQRHPEIKGGLALDEKTRERIEGPFRTVIRRLDNSTLTPGELIDSMVTTEFSEWNDIFLYVVNTLKRIAPEFKYAAVRMQRHLRRIEHFLDLHDGGRDKINVIRELEAVWEEKILVVEDNQVFAKVLEAVLKKEGEVEAVGNGVEALEKIRSQYYRLIVSDIDMPEMDGIEFYRQASALFPDIHKRFLFLSGNISSDDVDFFEREGIDYLEKPASIHDIRDKALRLMHRIDPD